ncbi:MAG: hypothetical protein WCE94_11980 [Candidatus Methanoperedens sp.]
MSKKNVHIGLASEASNLLETTIARLFIRSNPSEKSSASTEKV